MNFKFEGIWARAARFTAVLGAAAALAACGGGGGGGSSDAGEGTLRVALTDAMSCDYEQVLITVEKVRVHQSAGASDADSGWSELVISPPRQIDLRTKTNGVLEELGTMPLAAGKYSQIRLVLASNTSSGTGTMANAVKPKGSALTPLETPSSQQSGLKLQAHFEVIAGQMADLLLDFDPCRSVVKAGKSGRYQLKPVVSVVPRIVSGIQGFVATTLSLGSTTVAVQQNGATVRATVPDSNGMFYLPYLAGGSSYNLVVMSDGRATAVVTGVPTGSVTTVVNGTATAIAPPASAMADVTGTVTLSSLSGSTTVSTVITDANARALQELTGGPTIELGNKPVDGVLGSYSFRLPVAAPVKAAYAAGSPLSFAADGAVAGKYTIEMQSPGRAMLSKPADISSGTPAAVNFNYGP